MGERTDSLEIKNALFPSPGSSHVVLSGYRRRGCKVVTKEVTEQMRWTWGEVYLVGKGLNCCTDDYIDGLFVINRQLVVT